MSKRDSARAEAAFERGDVGVDGGATEEKKDAAEVELDKAREQLLRGKTYLGREFLTWLLWRSEAGEALLEHEGEGVVVAFQGRLTLRGVHGDVTELSTKGTLAPYSEQVRFGLLRGLLVHQARLRLIHGERTFEVTLDAEFLDIRAAKLPELLTEEEDDRAAERLNLVEQLSAMVEQLALSFLEIRKGRRWSQKTVPAMRAWMSGDAERPSLPARAARTVKPGNSRGSAPPSAAG